MTPHPTNTLNGTYHLESYSDAYGSEAATLLERIAYYVDQATLEFVNHFYNELEHRTSTIKILNRLKPEEYAGLRRKQADYLRFLVSPRLTADAHFQHACQVGRVHALVGLELPIMMEAYHLYQFEIHKILETNTDHGLSPKEQQQLLRALQLRLMLDMEAQITSYAQSEAEMTDLFSAFDMHLEEADNLSDLLQGLVKDMVRIEGISGCLFLRSDRKGFLQIEEADEALGRQYADLLQHDKIHSINTREDTPSGQGPAGLAWRTGQIELNESYESDSRTQPWRSIAESVGFRSSAAIPLIDESQQPIAIVSLYSQWPGFFNHRSRLTHLKQVQKNLSFALPRFEYGRVVPERQRREYRKRLNQGGVRLFYQPIFDLRNGRINHVEALARMYAVNNKVITPDKFLPAFGKADLFKLFEIGITQATRDLQRWSENAELACCVSLNLPTEGLIDLSYRDVLFEAIQLGNLIPSQIRLELLETNDPSDSEIRDERLSEFRQAGIALVQDDLGSGHSSLLRMDRIAFDEVKIDQGLVRNAMNAPQRALEFIYHLTRLAHGFGVSVTVEGVENLGLIEAAAILGADHAQGYGFAPPMTADELPAWYARHSYSIDPENPRTSLGALAGYLLWDQQLSSLAQWPDLIEEFIQTPSLVQRYIVANQLVDTPFHACFESNLACALRGRNSSMYQHTKKEFVRQLSERCIQENKA